MPWRQEGIMRKAVLWAILWTVSACGNVFLMLKHEDYGWDSVAFAVLTGCLAFLCWQEVVALRRKRHGSEAGPPAA